MTTIKSALWVIKISNLYCTAVDSTTVIKVIHFLQPECSHKVIEKRRRDRINTSLGELSQLLPAQTNGKQVLFNEILSILS